MEFLTFRHTKGHFLEQILGRMSADVQTQINRKNKTYEDDFQRRSDFKRHDLNQKSALIRTEPTSELTADMMVLGTS